MNRRALFKTEAFGLSMTEVQCNIVEYIKKKFDLEAAIIRNHEGFLISIAELANVDYGDISDDAIIDDLVKHIAKELQLSIDEVCADYIGGGYQVYVNIPLGVIFEANEGELDTLRGEKKSTKLDKKVDRHFPILDDNFIWLFDVLDAEGDIIASDIVDYQEALDILFKKEVSEKGAAVLIMATPYVDPDPENPDVLPVFADNPGPQIFYDRERATAKVKPEGDN